ncbi:MAG: hypothetical protein KGM47_14525 [Acidobacteriota bacterium]|nr:hypothetical protein [Acidobacteriota bacterium]
MTKRLTMLIAALTIFGCLAFGATSWVGVVSDSMCGAKHSKASAEAAQCVASCVAKGSKYVLVSHGKVYDVDPQSDFADYAGRMVRVNGKLTGNTIAVTSVSASHMGHHHAAKSKTGE